jgi:hypothetical protein
MAVIQAVLALISRSLGRITSAIFGWAVVALFGQTSPSEKTVLSALVAAAAAWPVLLLGIAMPKVTTFVLGFIPLPDWVPAWTVRAVWIGLAVAVPFAVGLTMALRQQTGTALSPTTRPVARDSRLKQMLRGIPATIGVAAAFMVVFVTVPVLRVMSFIRRRVDVQVPLITDAEHYHAVAAQVARVLTFHDFQVRDAKPGWWMTVPSWILRRLGGPAFRDHVPDRLAYFRGPRLEVALYPTGLLLRGSEQDTAWAHGLVVEALTSAPALQTFDPRAQELERQIRRVWSVYRENPPAHEGAEALAGRVTEIASELGRLPVGYDEWQIVYRQTLQLGRALTGEPPLLGVTSSEPPERTERRAVEEDRMETRRTAYSPRHLSNRALISEITGKASLLAKKEIELAKAEIRADLKSQLATVKAMGIAAIAALLGVNTLLVAVVLALATRIPGWLSALIVGGAILVIGAVVAYVGWRRMVTNPLALTRQTLKEDVQWVKERLA